MCVTNTKLSFYIKCTRFWFFIPKYINVKKKKVKANANVCSKSTLGKINTTINVFILYIDILKISFTYIYS
jgi:hypothetical protein